jgi:hypothetical protein
MFDQPMDARDRFEDTVFIPRTNAQVTVLVDVKPERVSLQDQQSVGQDGQTKVGMQPHQRRCSDEF